MPSFGLLYLNPDPFGLNSPNFRFNAKGREALLLPPLDVHEGWPRDVGSNALPSVRSLYFFASRSIPVKNAASEFGIFRLKKVCAFLVPEVVPRPRPQRSVWKLIADVRI